MPQIEAIKVKIKDKNNRKKCFVCVITHPSRVIMVAMNAEDGYRDVKILIQIVRPGKPTDARNKNNQP